MMYPHWDQGTAELLALFAHSGQTDKAGQDYGEHPARVVGRLRASAEWQTLGSSDRSVVIMAAWLHDVFEDTMVPLSILYDTLCPIEVIKIVRALTHRPSEARKDYYDRIKAAGPLAVMVKVADIQDNLEPARLMLLDVETQRRLRYKYEEAIHQLNINIGD